MILQSRRSNDPETLRQNGPLKTKSGKETCVSTEGVKTLR